MWPWWSVSKTALATCALRLAARGTVALDTPLPHRRYSLRHLLAHTSGLGCYGGLPAYHRAVVAGDIPWSSQTVLARMGNGIAEVPAGTRWAYSNVGYLIARQYLEEATGQPLCDLLAQEVLRPAGLTRTWLASGKVDLPHLPDGQAYDFDWVYHGCLIGPASEAAMMMQAILDGTLLDQAELDALTHRQPLGGAIPGRPWTAIGYGLGLMSGDLAGVRAEGHSGAGPFSTCAVYRVAGQVAAAFATTASEATPERAVLRASRIWRP